LAITLDLAFPPSRQINDFRVAVPDPATGMTMFGNLSPKRPQQVFHLSIDEFADPADKATTWSGF
jgi:hypothetical protein